MLPEISVCPAQVTESSHQPSLEYLKQMGTKCNQVDSSCPIHVTPSLLIFTLDDKGNFAPS